MADAALIPAPDTPKYVWIMLAAILVVVVILSVQVLYVRTALGRFNKDDYYKQLLVKNEYTTTQTVDACSNFGIYAWHIDTNLAKQLNTGVVYNYVATKIDTPYFFYTVPTKDAPITVKYKSIKHVKFIPLHKNASSTSRFIADMLAHRVDYVTWQKGLFRVVYIPSFQDQLKTFFEAKGFANVQKLLESTAIIALIQIPTLSDLAQEDFALASLAEADMPNNIVQTFIGESQLELNIDSLPNSLHIVGYKV